MLLTHQEVPLPLKYLQKITVYVCILCIFHFALLVLRRNGHVCTYWSYWLIIMAFNMNSYIQCILTFCQIDGGGLLFHEPFSILTLKILVYGQIEHWIHSASDALIQGFTKLYFHIPLIWWKDLWEMLFHALFERSQIVRTICGTPFL